MAYNVLLFSGIATTFWDRPSGNLELRLSPCFFLKFALDHLVSGLLYALRFFYMIFLRVALACVLKFRHTGVVLWRQRYLLAILVFAGLHCTHIHSGLQPLVSHGLSHFDAASFVPHAFAQLTNSSSMQTHHPQYQGHHLCIHAHAAPSFLLLRSLGGLDFGLDSGVDVFASVSV